MAEKNQNEKVFAQGIFCKIIETQYGAFPSISIKLDNFLEFAEEHKTEEGWVNIDFKTSKTSGNMYGELNTYQANKNKNSEKKTSVNNNKVETVDKTSTGKVDDLPF